MTTNLSAVIVEPRKHKALAFVLRNVLECLECPVLLFHGTQNLEFIQQILETLPPNRITLVNLGVNNLNQKTYSELLATESILYKHIHTEYFLVFQTDSMIFKQNVPLLYECITKGYEYVGAPWKQTMYPPTRERGYVGNGGLSLRKTEAMRKIIAARNWVDVKDTLFEWAEDLFFTKPYAECPLKKPTFEEAKKFCVEEVFSEWTFGCHKPWFHDHYTRFKELYPEVETLRQLNT